MRIIFSRKGFDGASGGCPSPIVDGTPIPLPIPTRQPTVTNYAQLEGDYGGLVSDLTAGRVSATSSCHLDPDIDQACLPRRPGWRGALGQVSAALSHLENQGVGEGDLFLFWGCYREAIRRTGRWAFVGPITHLIFGWLQVGRYHRLGADGSHLLPTYPWLSDHPHVRSGWGRANGIFIAADAMSAPGFTASLPGWGVLERGYQLSMPGRNPSVWQTPDWLNPSRGGAGMTYHPKERWSADGTVQCVGRGQEFVAHVADDARVGEWLCGALGDGR